MNPISKITSNRRIIRLALVAAVAVGISGSTYYSTTNQSDINLYNSLRTVSSVIFLVVTALLVIHTLLLAREERAARGKSPPPLSIYRSATQHFILHAAHGELPSGAARGMPILCLIVIMLLIREIYLTATIKSKQHEATWYPLAVLPEFLAVALFAVPKLVPEKRELLARAHDREKNPESTELV